jgi:hypothetical protein
LYLKVFVNAVLGALTAQTRLLHTSERCNLQNAQPHPDSEHCMTLISSNIRLLQNHKLADLILHSKTLWCRLMYLEFHSVFCTNKMAKLNMANQCPESCRAKGVILFKYLSWDYALVDANHTILQSFSHTPTSSNIFCENVWWQAYPNTTNSHDATIDVADINIWAKKVVQKSAKAISEVKETRMCMCTKLSIIC